MPPITHLLVLLYNLGHCWVVIFHARSLAFLDLTGFIQFRTLWIFQCRDHDLPRHWLRCRCIVHSMAFTSERIPPVEADTAVDALRPRCRGAFLAHFLRLFLVCSRLFFLLSLSWALSLLSSLLFALTLNFLCYIQRHLWILIQTKTMITLWSLYNSTRCTNSCNSSVVVNPWDEFQTHYICNWDRIRFDLGVSIWR